MFYRSIDERSITTVGIVEEYEELLDVNEIVRRVSRRTVYSMDEVIQISQKPTKVMLFRLVGHLANPVNHLWLETNRIVTGNIQTIRQIGNEAFELILNEQRP